MGGGRREGSGWGSHVGCDQRIEEFGGEGSGGLGWGGLGWWGGQGGCERKIEVFVKIQKKNLGGGGGGRGRIGGRAVIDWSFCISIYR